MKYVGFALLSLSLYFCCFITNEEAFVNLIVKINTMISQRIFSKFGCQLIIIVINIKICNLKKMTESFLARLFHLNIERGASTVEGKGEGGGGSGYRGYVIKKYIA